MSNVEPLLHSVGSLWSRWDPHLHTPDTVLNDQYSGEDKWSDYFTKIEQSEPRIRVLGITDYFSIAQYERVIAAKRSGRLQDVALIFPNIELRLSIGTAEGAGVNIHLLVSPDDPEHVLQVQRFLQRLEFKYQGETYACSREDLIRLGRKHKPDVESELSALAIGSNQFKVDFLQLRERRADSEWIQQNCLIAVAGGSKDGSSGIRDSGGSFEAQRKSVEEFSQVIFSANPAQISFWLGQGKATLKELEEKWGGVKPCLHGSDAHSLNEVGNPTKDRYCWVKGDLSFESLQQACIEPAERVYIGATAPRGSLTSNTIHSIAIGNAAWMTPGHLKLNPGLIAIIGARGSGKTALADLIAFGGGSNSVLSNERSFVSRAKPYLKDAVVKIRWEIGETISAEISAMNALDISALPRVQYLSQQFVDELCSADGPSDALNEEIERVIFQAHPLDEREGASSFSELRQIRTASSLSQRRSASEAITADSISLAAERKLKNELPALTKQRAEIAKKAAQDKKERDALVGKNQQVRAVRHQEILTALETRRREQETIQRKIRALNSLELAVLETNSVKAPEMFEELQQEHGADLFTKDDWQAFVLKFSGNVDEIISRRRKLMQETLKSISGDLKSVPLDDDSPPQSSPTIPDDANLATLTVAQLQIEATRIGKLIGIDKQNSKKFSTLNEKITASNKSLEAIDQRVTRINQTDSRIEALLLKRTETYKALFSAISGYEAELQSLYAPLAERLNNSQGSLGRLNFTVRREVNLASWANDGESLLDLRKAGPFRGHGTLFAKAELQLLPAWQTGTPEEIAQALAKFVGEVDKELREHIPDGEDYRTWASKISDWLYSTHHISVAYRIQFDGIDVERLSPGTRGIVLLLLYLAIDTEDDRPLIIDQPEENLDPKSIYDELVLHFRAAKSRRQIIIVTHNANLVVNTDADQIIVATVGGHTSGQLPMMTYETGGLESPSIRNSICNILEGGERAFRARAKRLRLKFVDRGARSSNLKDGENAA